MNITTGLRSMVNHKQRNVPVDHCSELHPNPRAVAFQEEPRGKTEPRSGKRNTINQSTVDSRRRVARSACGLSLELEQPERREAKAATCIFFPCGSQIEERRSWSRRRVGDLQ